MSESGVTGEPTDRLRELSSPTLNRSRRGEAVWRGFAIVAALAFVAIYLVLAGLRIGYPFELEWMEGGGVDQIGWILQGRPVYGPPSLAFVPYLYTPLYFYLSAAIAKLIGIGFVAPRLVSLLASLGIFALIGGIVRRHCGGTTGAALAIGLFAATYQAGGFWLDLARVDSLYLCFLLGGIFLVGTFDARWARLTGAVAFVAAVLTKQSALFVLPLIGVGSFLQLRWRCLEWIAPTLLLGFGSFALLETASDGWFTYYAFELPRGHPILSYMHLQFWWRDLLLRFIPTMILFLLAVRELRPNWSGKGVFLGLTVLSLIATTWLIRVRSGSYLNVLIPAYAALAILFGFSIQTLRNATVVLAPRWVCYFLAIVQLLIFTYDPRDSVPTAEDREAGIALLEVIEGFEGEVYLPSHGHYQRLAGKRPLAHAQAVEDLMRGDSGREKAKLTAEIMRAIKERRFDAIILDGWWFQQMLDHYELSSQLFEDGTVFWPVTGKRTRPELILTPNSPAHSLSTR